MPGRLGACRSSVESRQGGIDGLCVARGVARRFSGDGAFGYAETFAGSSPASTGP